MCVNRKETSDFFSNWWDLFACFMPCSGMWDCRPGGRVKDLERMKEHLEAKLAEINRELARRKKDRAQS